MKHVTCGVEMRGDTRQAAGGKMMKGTRGGYKRGGEGKMRDMEIEGDRENERYWDRGRGERQTRRTGDMEMKNERERENERYRDGEEREMY